MPKVLEDLVSKLKGQGMPTSKAYAVGTSALQKSGKLPPPKGSKTKATKGSKTKVPARRGARGK